MTLARVSTVTTAVEIPQGQTLAQRDDPASGMYAIEEGAVVVELGERSVELGAGDIVGELSLLVPDAHRSARVRAATPLKCLAISSVDVTTLLEEEPAFARALLESLARRLLDEFAE